MNTYDNRCAWYLSWVVVVIGEGGGGYLSGGFCPGEYMSYIKLHVYMLAVLVLHRVL